MRVLMDQESYAALLDRHDHPADCYVRPGEYLHHTYQGAIKYLVGPAVHTALAEARERNDHEAIAHLSMHEAKLRQLASTVRHPGTVEPAPALGDLERRDAPAQASRESFVPHAPTSWEQTGMNRGFLLEGDGMTAIGSTISGGSGCSHWVRRCARHGGGRVAAAAQ